jgi:hypothetical protein
MARHADRRLKIAYWDLEMQNDGIAPPFCLPPNEASFEESKTPQSRIVDTVINLVLEGLHSQ